MYELPARIKQKRSRRGTVCHLTRRSIAWEDQHNGLLARFHCARKSGAEFEVKKEIPVKIMRTADQTLDEILTLAATNFKVSREKLTPDDDFFKTLGIDSLQAFSPL